jgi:hypothetical protein
LEEAKMEAAWAVAFREMGSGWRRLAKGYVVRLASMMIKHATPKKANGKM